MTSEPVWRCPLCGDELGLASGNYRCWNSSCGFSSWRPWIAPPRAKESQPLAAIEAVVILECLTAVARGPFFVDTGTPHDPYWEFPALFGFQQPEIVAILDQWPDVDHHNTYIRDLVCLCGIHLIGYPHRCEQQWSSFLSVLPEELARILEPFGAFNNAPCI